MQLPKQTIQKQNESESYAIVLYYLRKIGIFRNVTENDYGIDFEIELVAKGKVTGRYLKAQVKSSDNLYIRKDGVPTVGGIKPTTLRYWTEISRHTNVVLFAVDLKTERIYVSLPLFWQCARLLDGSESSRTIECISIPALDKLDVGESNSIATVLTLKAFWEPTIREQISVHSSILRRLKDFIQLNSDANHYDFHLPIDDKECFREFLDLAALFLRGKNIKDALPPEDVVHWMRYDHWHQKSQCEAPLNHECHGLMKVILPFMLDELECLRHKVIESGYYWVHTDPEYFELVCKYVIPSDRDEEAICSLAEREDVFYLENADYRVYQLMENARKPKIKDAGSES
jgi:hypothetical protein